MYVKTDENGVVEVYPYRLRNFHKDFPHISVPTGYPEASLAELNIFPVMETEEPAFDPATHKLVDGIPVFDGSTWNQVWDIVPLTQEEIDAYVERQKLLARPDAATQRLINIASIIKAIKTRQDGRDYVAANASNLPQLGAIVGDLVFVVANLVRLQIINRDDFFPDNE